MAGYCIYIMNFIIFSNEIPVGIFYSAVTLVHFSTWALKNIKYAGDNV